MAYPLPVVMMFRTEINPTKFPFQINHGTPTLLVGSCFTQNIGEKLLSGKIPTLINPFGVVYNPFSVATCIETVLNNSKLDVSKLQSGNDLWFSYSHHSSFSAVDREQCIDRINSSIKQAHTFIQNTEVIVVTFGTARIYRLRNSGEVVTNCHKTPASEFTNELISVDSIVNVWSGLIDKLLTKNNHLKIVFTVSPVRHWKDGATGNQLSKSILTVAVHKLVEQYAKNAFYFPSYEIMMDDLRDYRFYADDLLHPTPAAINYIWEKFQQTVFNSDTSKLIADIEKIRKAALHRPFNPNTTSHKKFVNSTLEQIKQINLHHPEVDFSEEISAFTNL